MKWHYLLLSIIFGVMALGAVGPSGSGSVPVGLLCAHVSGMWLGGFLLCSAASTSRHTQPKEKS